MISNISLTIAEPCHESWDKMSPAEQGKFCGSCNKQVMDFSSMSDAQLVAFFKKPSTGSVCGRFVTHQLERELSAKRKRLTWLRYFFFILLPALFFSKASGQRLMGKPSFTQKDTTRVPIDHEIMTLGMVLPTTISPVCKDTVIKTTIVDRKVKQVKVAGRVVDEEGNGIPAATILITGSGKILKTDDEGRFTFISASDNLLEFICSSIGFQSQPYIYPFTLQYSSEVEVTVQMKKAVVELKDVLLDGTICRIPKSYKMGGVTISGEQAVGKDTATKVTPPENASVKFYPNPVKSGQTLHIALTALEEGYYRWQLVDISGKVAQQTEIWIDKDATLVDFRIPFVSSGTYIAVLVNRKTGKRFSEKIIVD
jgi:hypothetical protein